MAAEPDPADNRGGNAGDHTESDDPAQIGSEEARDGDRSRCRRNERMSDCDTGKKRNRVVEQRATAASGQAVDQRDEEDQGDIKEHGHRNDETG
jgi:hypothetical protein